MRKSINIAFVLATALFVTLAAWFILTVWQAKQAEAIFHEDGIEVPICHCELVQEGDVVQCQDLELPIPSAITHLGQHELDYPGECQQEEYCAVESWSCQECQTAPGDNACFEPKYGFCAENFGCQFVWNENGNGYEEEWVCRDTCEPPENGNGEPEVPHPQPILGVSEPSEPGPPQVCQGSEIKFAPTILGFERLTPTDVRVWWSEVDEHISRYVVWYGLSADNLVWNEKVAGQETTLHLLPPNQHIWVAAQGTDECIVGQLSEIIDP